MRGGITGRVSGRRLQELVNERRVTQMWLAGRMRWVVSKASRCPSDVMASGVATHAQPEKVVVREPTRAPRRTIRGDVVFRQLTRVGWTNTRS